MRITVHCVYLIFLRMIHVWIVILDYQNSFLLYTYSYHSTILDLDNSILQCMYNNSKYMLIKNIDIIRIRKYLKSKTNKLINYYYKESIILKHRPDWGT